MAVAVAVAVGEMEEGGRRRKKLKLKSGKAKYNEVSSAYLIETKMLENIIKQRSKRATHPQRDFGFDFDFERILL